MDDRHPTAPIHVGDPSLTADGAPRRCEGHCKVPGPAASKFPDPQGLSASSTAGFGTKQRIPADHRSYDWTPMVPVAYSTIPSNSCLQYSGSRQLRDPENSNGP